MNAKPELIVVNENGHTSSSTSLPESLLCRWMAGDSMEALTEDYGIPKEQVSWGIELAAWRNASLRMPPKTFRRLLTHAAEIMGGYRNFHAWDARSKALIFATAVESEQFDGSAK